MKPIFTVKIPNSCTAQEEVEEITLQLKSQLYDYHVIVVATETDEITFECFNVGCGCQIK
jgi:hypothetical protein